MPCGNGTETEAEQLAAQLNQSELWQNIADWVKNLVVKVPHVDAHV